jgi:hypothetical protein
VLEAVTLRCPYCGESFSTGIDVSVDAQGYVEDCAVCCRPIVIEVEAVDGQLRSVRTRREQD